MQVQRGLKASHMVALRIAKCKKPHTIGENLILPSAQDMCREILREELPLKCVAYLCLTIQLAGASKTWPVM